MVANFLLASAWVTSHSFLGRRRVARERHLVIFAWEFPPSISGGVYRPAALARYASRAQWRVTVFAGPPPETPTAGGLSLQDYVGREVRVVNVKPTAILPSYKLFPQIDGGLLLSIAMFRAARTHLSDAPPSAIVATGPPFNAFVAALFTSRWSRVPFTLDYRDEWVQSPFDFVSKTRADARWEKRCLSAASRIIFTTSSQQKRLCQVHPLLQQKRSYVIANGWDPVDHPSASNTPRGSAAWPLTLLFAGKLGGHTQPDRFLHALVQLVELDERWRHRVRVRFLGSKVPSVERTLARFPYPEMVESMAPVARAEAAKLIHDADALLLFHDERFERYLPGKLYEYLVSNRPIIAVDDTGESRDLIRTLDAGFAVASDDAVGIGAALTAIVAQGARPLGFKRKQWLTDHTRERLANQYLDVLGGP